jgi:hypothetical protein
MFIFNYLNSINYALFKTITYMLKIPAPEFKRSVSVAVNKDIRHEPKHGKKYWTGGDKDNKIGGEARALTAGRIRRWIFAPSDGFAPPPSPGRQPGEAALGRRGGPKEPRGGLGPPIGRTAGG